MRIFVFEYITGGGLIKESLPTSLAQEGALMVNAICKDLLDIPNVELSMTLDNRISPPKWATGNPRVTLTSIDKSTSFDAARQEHIARSDAIWPIAPETNGVLESFCQEVENSGKILINSSSEAVRKTASKLNTHNLMVKWGIPVIATYPLAEFQLGHAPPWVVKPDDGVGCDGSHILLNEEELINYTTQNDISNSIIQPYIQGESISLSLFTCQGSAQLLSGNRQIVENIDGMLKIKGCQVNGIESIPLLENIADKIAQAVPGLSSYVGVDLLQTKTQTLVLEINPRLTTSYAGLREVLTINPAKLILDGVLHKTNINKIPLQTAKAVTISMAAVSDG